MKQFSWLGLAAITTLGLGWLRPGNTVAAAPVSTGFWDTYSDTWVATDALGRSLPGFETVGGPRADRTVGIFYFLWLGRHGDQGPFDITRILATDPDAMAKPDSPLWGPLHAPHHWGESCFGYYLSDDEGVLARHAQMLADAQVDVVIFDVTNQLTYPRSWRALLSVWTRIRQRGGRTPQVAFLCPFWEPARVVDELYRELYRPGLSPELWFRWEGKPLILADPALLAANREVHHFNDRPDRLEAGQTLGQTFRATNVLESVGGCFPTWRQQGGAVTLTLREAGPAGRVLASARRTNLTDNSWQNLELDPPAPPGDYAFEISDGSGTVGWWSSPEDRYLYGEALANGKRVAGDRSLRLVYVDEIARQARSFFTFRKPQPDYFQGPTQPDMWSWLEVYPQHVFRNRAGEKEQMSVGVAQNAVSNRLGSMSEPGARGRSFHQGAQDARPQAVRYGLNVAEQWNRALSEDPRFIFITGWNEWIAGRFNEFAGIKRPVMFVDQFDQEHSRDIEPMRGGHGDDYYYQMVSYIRRYKGVRAPPSTRFAPIQIDGRFEDWERVQPEFRDDRGDPARRDHPGWSRGLHYRNETGRHDLVLCKGSADDTHLFLLVQTADVLLPVASTNWMLLFLDVDGNPANGWLGYDYVLNRQPPVDVGAALERHTGEGYPWTDAGRVRWKAAGTQLELAIPWRTMGLTGPPPHVDFKWGDNILQTGDWSDFTLNGDVAPNGRFNYRLVLRAEQRATGDPSD